MECSLTVNLEKNLFYLLVGYANLFTESDQGKID
jgi:hypothetical protein